MGTSAITVIGTPRRAEAAPVSLIEVPGTPLVTSFGSEYADRSISSTFSSPAIADVTGDGQPEVIVGGMNSQVQVYDLAHGGKITLNPGGYDPATQEGNTTASPAIADLDGDGVNDIVFVNTSAQLAAYSVRDGVVRELYNRFVPPAFEGAINGLFATPAIGYVDRDDRPDVVTSNWGQMIEAWSGPSGQPIPQTSRWVWDSVWSSPAIGDITGDGTHSIVVGGDCEGGGPIQPCYGQGGGGYVWAFDLNGHERWRHFVPDAVIWSSPALFDLNDDGALDVVVGTGLYWLGPEANKMIALDGKTGAVLWEAQTEGPTFGSPSAAMVNGEPRLWAVVGGGKVYSWDASGNQLWATCVTDGGNCSQQAGTFGGVAIADINNDGALDAVVSAEQQVRVLDAVSGQETAEARSSYPHTLFSSNSTPTVAEVNGQTWIAHLTIGDANGNLQRDAGDAGVVTVWRTGTSLGDAPWPTFKANMARTGGPAPTQPPPSSQPIPPGAARPPVGPGASVCTAVAADPGDAAFVNVTPVEANAPGYGLLTPSSVNTPPTASNVNFSPGTIDPNVAVAAVGGDGEVCYRNSALASVHVILDHLGAIDDNNYVAANTNGAPARKVDTRIGVGGTRLAPSSVLCFAVAGSPGDTAVVNLTPVLADAPGNGLLTSSNATAPPVASNVNFGPGTIDPNVAFAPIGTDGQVCFRNSEHANVDLVADHLGTITGRAYTPADPSGAPIRKIDTRIGQGGTRMLRDSRICTAVSGRPGDGAVFNLTPVLSDAPGYGLLTSSAVGRPPVASNVNFDPSSIDPNVAIAPIGPDGQVCFHNSHFGTVELIADHLGTIEASAYTPGDPSGAPVRLVDSRS